MNKSMIVAAIAVSMVAVGFATAVPNPFACGPQAIHNYDADTAGVLTVVYNQCLDPTSPSNTITGTDDEWASGIDGAFFNAANDVVGVNDPSNDLVSGTNTDAYTTVNPANVGGVNNCFPGFSAHHGAGQYINTQDAVQGGNVRVFITADQHDDPGEQAYNAILTANGGVWPAGVDDPRDPCGDNSIDATDFDVTSDPCNLGTYGGVASNDPGNNNNPGPYPTGGFLSLTCGAINTYDTGVVGGVGLDAGLDGNVVTFIGISTGNVSVATTGITWTS